MGGVSGHQADLVGITSCLSTSSMLKNSALAVSLDDPLPAMRGFVRKLYLVSSGDRCLENKTMRTALEQSDSEVYELIQQEEARQSGAGISAGCPRV